MRGCRTEENYRPLFSGFELPAWFALIKGKKFCKIKKINRYVFRADFGDFEFLFGPGQNRWDNLKLNRLRVFCRRREADSARRKFQKSFNDSKTRIARINIQIPEGMDYGLQEAEQFCGCSDLIVIAYTEFGNEFFGANTGKRALYGTPLCQNHYKTFSNFESAKLCWEEVIRQGQMMARIARFRLREIPEL